MLTSSNEIGIICIEIDSIREEFVSDDHNFRWSQWWTMGTLKKKKSPHTHKMWPLKWISNFLLGDKTELHVIIGEPVFIHSFI